jgi:hypothetical protein
MSEPFFHMRNEQKCGLFRSSSHGMFQCDGCGVSVHHTDMHPEQKGQRKKDPRLEWDYRLEMPPPAFRNQVAKPIIKTQWERRTFDEIPDAKDVKS